MIQKLSTNPYIIIGSVIVTVLSAILSIYFYVVSQSYRAPTFIVDTTKTEILNKSNIEQAPIKVTRVDGSEITSDLTSVQFYFWNNGKESIKSENIQIPLEINFDDPSVEIIDKKILAKSTIVNGKDYANIELERKTGSLTNTLLLTFDTLEFEDGFTGQVIYAGNRDAKLVISGKVEDVKELNNEQDMLGWWSWIIPNNVVLIIMSLVIFLGLTYLSIVFTRIIFTSSKKTDPQHIDRVESASTVLHMFIVIFLLLSIVNIYNNNNSLLAPPSILPK